MPGSFDEQLSFIPMLSAFVAEGLFKWFKRAQLKV
jgi:hypothetical protein